MPQPRRRRREVALTVVLASTSFLMEVPVAEVPSAERYARALRGMELAHALPDTYWRLLRAHYRAPAHTATATELAAAVGFATYAPVNLHYGTFGATLAGRLHWPVPDGQPQAFTFATFEGGSPDAPHTRWVLRPEVVAALEQLRWAPPPVAARAPHCGGGGDSP